jgi:IS5 family transposase
VPCTAARADRGRDRASTAQRAATHRRRPDVLPKPFEVSDLLRLVRATSSAPPK